MSRVDEIRAFVEQVHPTLDQRSYYDLLGLTPEATPDEVREAFYVRAGRLHPDRYARLGHGAVREKLAQIYGRITEAYKVLADPAKRVKYNEGLAEGRTRIAAVTEREIRKEDSTEENVKAPAARKFAKLALTALRGGDLRSAQQNFKLALSMEPGNAWLEQQLRKVEARAAGGSA